VPFGTSISNNGRTVWAAYDDTGRLVTVAATADEARRKYRDLRTQERIKQQASAKLGQLGKS
jgi:YD repeat-containing protein